METVTQSAHTYKYIENVYGIMVYEMYCDGEFYGQSQDESWAETFSKVDPTNGGSIYSCKHGDAYISQLNS